MNRTNDYPNKIEYLQRRLNLHQKIIDDANNGGNGTHFLKPYSLIQSTGFLRSEKEAINKLFENIKLSQLITQLQQTDFDIYIGGSIGLYCVSNKNTASFQPGDIDLYIPNITNYKICILENVLKNVFDEYEVFIVRNAINITWWFFKRTNNPNYQNYIDANSIQKIQVCIFNYRSMSWVFDSYHSDIVCVGYDIHQQQFIYLDDRFNHILNDTVNWFCSIFNFDNPAQIHKSAIKYCKRGYNAKTYIIFTPDMNNYIEFYISGNSTNFNNKFIQLEDIVNIYPKSSPIAISSSARDMFECIEFTPYEFAISSDERIKEIINLPRYIDFTYGSLFECHDQNLKNGTRKITLCEESTFVNIKKSDQNISSYDNLEEDISSYDNYDNLEEDISSYDSTSDDELFDNQLDNKGQHLKSNKMIYLPAYYTCTNCGYHCDVNSLTNESLSCLGNGPILRRDRVNRFCSKMKLVIEEYDNSGIWL